MAINVSVVRVKTMIPGRQSLKNGSWLRFSDLGSGISMNRFIAVMVLLLACGVLLFCLCAYNLLGPVDSSSSAEETIFIRHGMNAAEIGSVLTERGFIRSAPVFRLASMLRGASKSLKAGEYVFSRDMSMLQILRKIEDGITVLYKFTIPEGFALRQIARLWEEKGFGLAVDFSEVARDPAMLEKYGVDSKNLEGYLFPDTYMFPHGISEREAVDKMLHQFGKKMSDLSEVGDMANYGSKDLTLSRHEIISLASIIEREAKVEQEKPIISSVFYNRLMRGRKLESCATVLYSLGYPGRKLTENDLKNTQSPYNTYLHKGLPPGPICSPGLGSIAAAFNPSDDKYLYFVSKNDGTHYFAETYRDFLNAKRKYRDI